MEPRDLVGSARPKEADLQGCRAGSQEVNQLGAVGVGLVRGDDVINNSVSEGEGLDDQGEGLMEEQEFSIKEASFQEGSLKLKIQTTKRTKKPPKSLENYICPPEIRMTIRPPAGEGKGGRQGRVGGEASMGRSLKDEERGPPRKRTYERQFRVPDQRDGGLLQLLGDPGLAKHALRTEQAQQQTQHSGTAKFQNTHPNQAGPEWITPTAPSSSPGMTLDSEPVRDLGSASRDSLLDPTQALVQTATQSPSPQRFLTPDLQLPVVTDASILNLTSLSRGKGLQEVSEQLFGNIKRKYGRKDCQRMPPTPHAADAHWERQQDRESEIQSKANERQRYREEETAEQFPEERVEKRKHDREQTHSEGREDEEGRGAAMFAGEMKGRRRRRRPSFDEPFFGEEQSKSDSVEKSQSGLPEPKVSNKSDAPKADTCLPADRAREKSEKAERLDKNDKREKGERIDKPERGEVTTCGLDKNLDQSANKMKKFPVGRPKSGTDLLKLRDPIYNHISKPNYGLSPRLSSLSPSSSSRAGSSPAPSPRPRANNSPVPSPKPRVSNSPAPSPKPRANMSPSPRPNTNLSPSPSHSHVTSSPSSSRLAKGGDRWSYLKARSHSPLTSPQRETLGNFSKSADPPSPFPITPSSPLYSNTDSLTVHAPVKRKRGRPKKQPLLTVETIHEGTSMSPPRPLSQEMTSGLGCRRKTHALNTLVKMASTPSSASSNSLKLKKARGNARPLKKSKLGKMQTILNEILSSSSQNGSLALKSSSTPVSSAMSAMASTIEARLGKQINVSKRGTIYIGKKRGRKPRAETQGCLLSKVPRDKPPMSISMSSMHESLAVSSATSHLSSGALALRAAHSEAAMPSLQPISALTSKPLSRGFLSGGWKLSPPQLLANSPSHLSEGASVKEATLSPISESHSEETIPSDSGIGTDNNSTSDQTEKGHASRRRYSFDLCGFESVEAAAQDTSNRNSRTRCDRQITAIDSFLSQQEKKQKHHRRKKKCLQSRDHLHFLSELDEVLSKLQQLRVSHRRFTCYPQHPYPSIFRLNFHHYYPVGYNSYPCNSSSYLRRSADLKVKRRRGRPAKASEPITSKMPFVQGYGYPLGGGNYYAAPYAMPYPPPLSQVYFPHTPPFYLPHHSFGPAPPSPFMRPAIPPPKAFHTGGHSKLPAGAKSRGSSGSLPDPAPRGEGLGSMSSGGAAGIAGVRLHKRKHKHKHRHKDEPLLSPQDQQELGGLFSGAKTTARFSLLNERRDMSGQSSAKHQDKPRASGRGLSLGSGFGIFESDQLSTQTLADRQFLSHRTAHPAKSFTSSYGSQGQPTGTTSDLFLGSREDEFGGRSRVTRLATFGEENMMSFQTARQEPGQMNKCSSPPHAGVPGKRRYKRREVEQIQKDVKKMHSLNFNHVQKILRAKRLQRQAKTGNNVIKRRPGRPRKQPLEEPEPAGARKEDWALGGGLDVFVTGRGDGRSLGMPVLERCDSLPSRQSHRPSSTPKPLEFSNHDSISAAIETVVHQARAVPPSAKAGRRRASEHQKDELWVPNSQ